MNPAKIFSDFFSEGTLPGSFLGLYFGKYGWVQAGSMLSKGHPGAIRISSAVHGR